ncbi:protein kinase [Luteolibacter yonseiensis]|uniref:Protein kinase n=1 Tax=Luteolibacter yonseiensis TaxID=1144680 RepID=A0A934R4V1_9BACT|nr:leucine-rich repeat-containing protein kinase family protein [Luteolibacter yonseiensis]MBK1816972.1 protein kinase [Luteolibacter yonseiensis]
MSHDTLTLLRSGGLHGIHRLDLAADLTEFPREIYDLADTLEILNLSDNQLAELPDDLPRLKKLRIIFCSGNRFTRLPEVLGGCPDLEMIGFRGNHIGSVPAAALPPNLRWLVLTDNRISELPPEIGLCKRLQKLMLSGNLLTALPAEMSALKSLELVRLSANRLEKLPGFLLSLPRLAWLAFGGNPCSPVPAVTAGGIDWDRIETHEKLGEGASGVVFKARLKAENGYDFQDVAVKLFKGGMTSDGLPESEISACLAAGTHPGLIEALGRIIGHPDGTAGLVMRLADPDFHVLAGPPDLRTCTQDIYPEDRHFPYAVARRMAGGIAKAAGHLHSRGVVHGDLYAHNILWSARGECLLGDFGAASSAPVSCAGSLEAIEIRAFGHLLGELLARVVPEKGRETDIEELLALKDHCLCPDPQYRPTFRDITDFLSPE